MPVVRVSRNKTLLVDSGQDSVVLAQAFDCSRFPLVQGESFSDLSCKNRAVRLASSVSNSTSPCNERTWNAKGTDTMTTSPERERPPPKTSTKKSTALRSPTGITPLGIYPVFIAIKEGGRPTRRLPHVKMLPVSISFFLCSVDYALEGSIFSLSKYDFSRLFHTERSWHTYRFTVVFVSGRQDFPGKNVRRDPANPTWDLRLIPGGIPPEIGGIPPGIPPGIMERPGRHPTWDPN